jgi:hypothetical protein
MAGGVFIIGPLWFALALLIFALGWVVWVTARRGASDGNGTAVDAIPTWPSWLLAAILVGATALLIRQWVPVGQSVFGLQLGYFASYTFLFALGCRAASGRWLERVSAGQARGWAIVSVLALPLVFIAAALSGALSGQPVNFNGGLGLPAVVYAFWEPFVAWGIIASLLYVFRTRFNTASARWSRWGSQAYGAFIVHAPVLVGVSVLAADWKGPVLLKFVGVTAAATALSFVIAGWLRRLPGANRIL